LNVFNIAHVPGFVKKIMNMFKYGYAQNKAAAKKARHIRRAAMVG
jgi:hypothetical protein